MTESFVFSRLESLEKRFQEVDLLLKFAVDNIGNDQLYSTFCRSAHIILIAHFEGAIKEVCKDVIDDINYNLSFDKIPKNICMTYAEYFLVKENNNKFSNEGIFRLKEKIKEAFGNNKANLNVAPFLMPVDRNLAPAIIGLILKRFGVNDFFYIISNSDLEIVFEDEKTSIAELKNRLKTHVFEKTTTYPYQTDPCIYNPTPTNINNKKQTTLWEEFIDDILMERHNIVHGHKLHNPYDHSNLQKAKEKIEILIYVFIICICGASVPNIDNNELEIV